MSSTKGCILEDFNLGNQGLDICHKYLVSHFGNYNKNILRERSSISELKERISAVKDHIQEIKTNDNAIAGVFSPITDMELKEQIKVDEVKLQLLMEQEQEKIVQLEDMEQEHSKLKEALDGLKDYKNENIKELGLKTLEIQEDERKRIAADLHDTAVQNLTYLIHKVELCTKLVDMDSIRCKLELQTMNKTIKSVIQDMRNTIYNLRPMTFDDIGLDITIERALENIKNQNKIEIEYTSSGDIDHINKIIAITVLRLIMEASVNSIKHSNASLVKIRLDCNENYIEISINDNGIGFDLESINKGNNNFGISMMKERVFLLSGLFKIETEENKGTEITIKLPISTEEEITI